MDTNRFKSVTLPRRTAVIAYELKKYNVDVVALQETHLRGEGQLEEKGAGYTYMWSGTKEDDPTDNYYGVAICAKSELVKSGIVGAPNCYNDRIMSVEIHGQQYKTIFVCCYAPTLNDEVSVIETFYQDLKRFLSAIPQQNNIILAGDFNARVGTAENNWKGVLGPHGIGRQNENGLRLLQLCLQLDLSICNTVFQQKNAYKTTWQHPRSKAWHQIDFVITRRKNLRNVLRCRSMKGPNCDTDHLLVRASVKLVKRRFQARVKNLPKSFNTTRLKDEHTRRTFENSISSLCPENFANRDVNSQWDIMKTSVLESATRILGKKLTSKWDWFDDSNVEIQSVLEMKRKMHLNYLNNPTAINKKKYAKTRSKCQQQIRAIKEQWWREKITEMQHYMDVHDTHNLHRCIKNIVGPVKKSLNILESITGEQLKTREERMERWREHFSTVLNQDTCVDLDSIRIPNITSDLKLPVDDTPSIEEINRAVGQLKNHKSAGSDEISAELLKGGGETIVNLFFMLFKNVWEEKCVPKDWTDAVVVPLHKKGKKSSCDNFRGISLLSVSGKVLSKVLCNRLTPFVNEFLGDSQCGFRPERSTVDMVFATRQLVEKALEQNTGICLAFVDIRKAFDSVNREALFEILERMHCPPNTLTILRQLHENTSAAVRVDGEEGLAFGVRTGVRQGCVLAPLLFLVYIQTIIANMSTGHQIGVDIIHRSDSNMFCRRGLKSKSKVTHSKVSELMFADDCALVALTPADLQTIITAFSEASESLGLQVNEEKTEVMFVNCQASQITLNNKTLKEVPVFKYLGSMISRCGDPGPEIQNRINAASQAFGKLYVRVWKPHDLSLKLKLAIYKSVVLSTLLYSSECWTILGKHIQKLNAFHLRCLRSICKISWEDRISSEEVLRLTGMLRIENIIRQRRLRWAGHVSRMVEDRIPHRIAFSELKSGQRPQYKPKKRWTDLLKEDINMVGLDIKSWRNAAADRKVWRTKVMEAIQEVHVSQMAVSTKKRKLRHEEEDLWDWKCPLCNFLRHGRRGRQYVQSHITQYHRDEAEAQKLISQSCQHCEFSCGTKAGLTSHLRHKHPDFPLPGLRPIKLLPANPDQGPPLTLQAPSASTSASAAAPPPSVGPARFTCERCGRVCASKAGLVSHSKGKTCQRQLLERRGSVGSTNA